MWRGLPGRDAKASRMTAPRVSIGMIVYNDERHLAEAIESLLAQTCSDFRLYISDDASTDETEAIARRYAKDARVSYHRNTRNLGMAGNYRAVFRLGGPGSRYFAWAAGHDVYHPDWLGRLVEALDENDETVLAYPRCTRIGEHGEEMNIAPTTFDTSHMPVEQRIAALQQ